MLQRRFIHVKMLGLVGSVFGPGTDGVFGSEISSGSAVAGLAAEQVAALALGRQRGGKLPQQIARHIGKCGHPKQLSWENLESSVEDCVNKGWF